MLHDGMMLTGTERCRPWPDLLGVRHHDRDRAGDGYTLFSPSWGNTVYLMDMRGLVVHTWQVTHSNFAVLLEDGNLFTHNCGSWLEELTPSSEVVWRWDGAEQFHQAAHHDFHRCGPDEIYTLVNQWEPVRPGVYPDGAAPSKC